MTKFKMNRTQFMLLTALNMLGSGILMLPAKVAQVGGIGLLSWFVVCLAAVAMAYAFANCGIYSKYRLGGLGAIAENAFGMPGSFLTNYIYAFPTLPLLPPLSAICWVFSAFRPIWALCSA